tara:strand:- start:211 stop:639 length:429 start_codon:yes stop_codon:yes gene_type:complete
LKSLFKSRIKRLSKNKVKGKKTPLRKKTHSKSRKIVNKKSYPFSPIYPSFIIFMGFMSLSLAMIFLGKQLKPIILNERLKYLCTYQLGDKKDQSYRDAKLQLEQLVGDSDKYCKNFLIPRENKKRRFNPLTMINDVLFRFIF